MRRTSFKERITPAAVLETYCYELLEYYDPETGWQPVPEVHKWAPSPPEQIEIPYTLNGIPQGSMPPSDIKEVNTLVSELTVVGSNLGGSITVCYELPQTADTRIAVYDVTGREVKTLVSGEQPAGEHELHWEGCDAAGREVSSGVYFVRMEAGKYQINRKVTLLR